MKRFEELHVVMSSQLYHLPAFSIERLSDVRLRATEISQSVSVRERTKVFTLLGYHLGEGLSA